MSDAPPASILITGASSGIGEALARAYAAPGVSLALGGRDAGRLESVAQACRASGAEAETAVLDVAEREAMAAWVKAYDATRPLDLVIANAGVSAGTCGVRGGQHVYDEPDKQTRRIFAVNLDGALNTVLPAIALMRARGRGQIALMSSLAGFRGVPGASAYSASKAAVKSWGEALRPAVAGDGVAVTVICPGFVESRITVLNRFPMPFILTAPDAARLIRRRLTRRPARIAFPLGLYLPTLIFAVLPPGLADLALAGSVRRAKRMTRTEHLTG
jgi:NADP-dependent 3-hydroxy acid dehydrogenase YdfG